MFKLVPLSLYRENFKLFFECIKCKFYNIISYERKHKIYKKLNYLCEGNKFTYNGGYVVNRDEIKTNFVWGDLFYLSKH